MKNIAITISAATIILLTPLLAASEGNAKKVAANNTAQQQKKPQPYIDFQQIFKRPKEVIPVNSKKLKAPCKCADFDSFEFTPYGPGEKFNYRAYVLGVYAGVVDAWVGKPHKDTGLIPLRVQAETNMFFSKIKKFTARMSSFIDTNTYLPTKAVADTRLDDRRRATTVDFNRKRNVYKANIIRGKRESKIYRKMPHNLHDTLSMLLNFRMIKIEKGKPICYDYLYSKRVWRVEGELVGTEIVKVPAGTFNCNVLQGKAVRKDKPHIPKYNLNVKLWVTDDDRRIIIKAVTQIRLGEAAIELQNYTPPKLKRKLLSHTQTAESCTLYADK